MKAPITSNGGNSVLSSVFREPFNLSNTADGEAAGSHKERPQRPMTASSAQAQHSPLPDCKQAFFFFFKGKKGESEEVPTTAHNVWEKQAAHINLKLSQLGGSP